MCGKRRCLFLNCIGGVRIAARIEKRFNVSKSRIFPTSNSRVPTITPSKITVTQPPISLPQHSSHPFSPGFSASPSPARDGQGGCSPPSHAQTSQCGFSLEPPQRPGGLVPPAPSPLPVRKEEARDMGTPEQLSSSKTQQVIPGERRQGRSARALTPPENQSIVTWRESRATAGPASPPLLGGRRSSQKGCGPACRETVGGGRRAPGAAGEEWGRPGRRGPAASLGQCGGFFLRELLAAG